MDLRIGGTGAHAPEELEVRAVAEAEASPIDAFRVKMHWQMTHSLNPGHYYGRFEDPVIAREGIARMRVAPRWREGEGVLHIRADGWAEDFVPVQAPIGGEDPEAVAVRLKPERVVSGTVVDRVGKPVAGAKVWAIPVRPNSHLSYGYIPQNAVLTDDEGRFELDGLGWRRYAVQAYHQDRAIPAAQEVDLENDNARGVDFGMTGLVRFTARWTGGPPGTGCYVELRCTDGSAMRGATFRGTSRSTSTPLDPAEPFQVSATQPGEYTLYLRRRAGCRVPYAMEWVLDTFSLTEDTEKTYDLDTLRTGSIAGRIVFNADHATLHRLVVVAESDGRGGDGRVRQYAKTLPDAEGSFRLEVPTGGYAVSVRDAMSDAVLWMSEEIVQVQNDGEAELEPNVVPARLRVIIEPVEGAERPAVQSLGLRIPHFDNRGVRGSRTLLLSEYDLSRPLDVLVPAGECELFLQRAAGCLSTDGRWRSQRFSGETVEVEAGRETKVVLREPPRPSIEELERKQ